MGCQCNKPEESNDEIRVDPIQIKDLEKENDLAQNNNNNLSSRSHNGKPDGKFNLYLFGQINKLR